MSWDVIWFSGVVEVDLSASSGREMVKMYASDDSVTVAKRVSIVISGRGDGKILVLFVLAPSVRGEGSPCAAGLMQSRGLGGGAFTGS